MTSEKEKRLRRCCFTGHRPEKLNAPEEEVKRWLEEQIVRAVADGFVTFISGCGMGVDIWAGQIVLQRRADNPAIHLIAAVPWPGFARRWSAEWQGQYNDLIRQADLVVNISDHFDNDVFQRRNIWMVDRCSRIIACYNGEAGGTRRTLDYAEEKGLTVISNTFRQPVP